MATNVSPPPERTLVITRDFDAPRELVFSAWTKPEHLAQWWGPRGFTLPSCELDLRPGGAYRFKMKPLETEAVWWHGVVREIVPPERLVLTCAVNRADGSKISGETILTVTLEQIAGKTRLTLQQGVFETAAIRDDHSNGWNSALQRLAEHLAKER